MKRACGKNDSQGINKRLRVPCLPIGRHTIPLKTNNFNSIVINAFILSILFACQVYGSAAATNIITDLQTDRYCYVSGDYIFLKVVCKPFGTDKTLKESMIYVDIANADSLFITGEIFKLNQGAATGFIQIPDTLKTGNYILRTYTYSSLNNPQHKILDSKNIFVTNRFNQSYQKIIASNSNDELKRDSADVEVEHPINDSSKFKGTVYNQESEWADSISSQASFDLKDTTIYINIFDVDSQFIASEVFKFNEGLASGYINIPDTVEAGMFLLKAYNSELEQKLDQRKADLKEINVSKQFAETGESNDGNDKNLRLSSGKVFPQKPSGDNYVLKLADTEFNRRSKVTGTIQFAHDNTMDTAWLALSVKPLSAWELQLALLNKTTEDNELADVCMDTINNSLHEDGGMIISGFLSDSLTNKPISNALVFIARVDSAETHMNYCISNKEGKFYFLESGNAKSNQVFISIYKYPEMVLYPNAKVNLDSKFLNNPTVPVNPTSKLETMESGDTLNVLKSIIAIAYDINPVKAQEDDSWQYVLNNAQSIIGEPTEDIELDDYVGFTDFIQMAKEILYSVRIQKEDNKYQIAVVDRERFITHKNPVVFVNGVPLENIDPILSWGSDKIKRIQIQSKPRYFGDVPFENGMIFIWTRKMDFWSGIEHKRNRVVNLPGYQKQVKLKFPDYSDNSNKRLPDFRQVLFWEPSIAIENNKTYEFSFYTSDEVGDFEVVLQGITNKNQVIEIREYFRVKKN